MNSFKSLSHSNPLPRSFAEAAKHLLQGNTINSTWKITVRSERWQKSFGYLRHSPFLPQVQCRG
jgi:hypothetical protein